MEEDLEPFDDLASFDDLGGLGLMVVEDIVG